MQIGQYQLENPFLLAPMAGVADGPFRRQCRRFGAAMASSEMTTADISLWQTAKSRRRLDLDLDAEPRVVQIAGSEPDQLARAAEMCEDRGAQIVDINMGCPAKKVCRKLAGSALLRDEDLVARILDAVLTAVTVPVTLKMRTGWNRQQRNGVRIAQIAERSGVQALFVHGRTRECRFGGAAEYETIAQIKDAVSIPVVANGDIDTAQKSLEVMRISSVDGLMIGRAALGRPWFFRELRHFLKTGEIITPLENAEVRDTILDHLDDLYQFYGGPTGVRVARKHLGWYCAGLANSGEFRYRVVRAESASEQVRLTRKFFSQHAERDSLAA